MCGRQYFIALAAVTAFAIGLNTVRCTLGQFGSDLVILSEDLYIATHMNYGGKALYGRRIIDDSEFIFAVMKQDVRGNSASILKISISVNE